MSTQLTTIYDRLKQFISFEDISTYMGELREKHSSDYVFDKARDLAQLLEAGIAFDLAKRLQSLNITCDMYDYLKNNMSENDIAYTINNFNRGNIYSFTRLHKAGLTNFEDCLTVLNEAKGKFNIHSFIEIYKLCDNYAQALGICKRSYKHGQSYISYRTQHKLEHEVIIAMFDKYPEYLIDIMFKLGYTHEFILTSKHQSVELLALLTGNSLEQIGELLPSSVEQYLNNCVLYRMPHNIAKHMPKVELDEYKRLEKLGMSEDELVSVVLALGNAKVRFWHALENYLAVRNAGYTNAEAIDACELEHYLDYRETYSHFEAVFLAEMHLKDDDYDAE